MRNALPLLAQLLLVSSAHAVSIPNTQCTVTFNRAIDLMNQGEASLCRNQQQFLDALDAAAAACAGGKVDFDAIKATFRATVRGCPTQGDAQGGGSSGPTPSGGNASPNSINSDGDRANQYSKNMEKCDQIPDPYRRTSCRNVATRAYQGKGSGPGVSANSNTGGNGGASSSPDENPDQRPKALPSQPKDPGVDYSGQACTYFTRPAVEDEVRQNVYAKDACVSYGNSSYECGADGRWLRKGPAEVFKCQTAQEFETSGHSIRTWDIRKK